MLRRTFLKRSQLRRRGPKADAWEKFSDDYAEETKNNSADGLIACWVCKRRFHRPDLHHVISRLLAPERYFDKTNLVWLCRKHHKEIHNAVNNLRECALAEK